MQINVNIRCIAANRFLWNIMVIAVSFELLYALISLGMASDSVIFSVSSQEERAFSTLDEALIQTKGLEEVELRLQPYSISVPVALSLRP